MLVDANSVKPLVKYFRCDKTWDLIAMRDVPRIALFPYTYHITH